MQTEPQCTAAAEAIHGIQLSPDQLCKPHAKRGACRRAAGSAAQRRVGRGAGARVSGAHRTLSLAPRPTQPASPCSAVHPRPRSHPVPADAAASAALACLTRGAGHRERSRVPTTTLRQGPGQAGAAGRVFAAHPGAQQVEPDKRELEDAREGDQGHADGAVLQERLAQDVAAPPVGGSVGAPQRGRRRRGAGAQRPRGLDGLGVAGRERGWGWGKPKPWLKRLLLPVLEGMYPHIPHKQHTDWSHHLVFKQNNPTRLTGWVGRQAH